MLPRWLTALLVLLHEMWSVRRDAHIRLMKLQIELLKKRIPGNRVILDPNERRQLMKIGAEVDHRIEGTIEIVNIKTYPTTMMLTSNEFNAKPGSVDF